MDVKNMIVTPELAESWLAMSNGNPRWVSGNKLYDRRKVEVIARDIESGNWNPGNGTIAFDENGALVDGHHRLAAIRKAGIPVQAIVIWGITKSGLLHIDDQNSRTVSQRIGIDSRIVAAANCYMRNRAQSVPGKGASGEAIKKWVSEHPLSSDALLVVGRGKASAMCRKGSVVCAAMEALESGVTEITLQKFFRAVNTGFIDNPYESAAIVLRNMLISKSYGTKKNEDLIYMAAQDAIYDYDHGVKRTRPYSSPKGAYMK